MVFWVVLLLLMTAKAFTGYVLPWGQMSLWGAAVITGMVTAPPVGGKSVVQRLYCSKFNLKQIL
jgi:quinol-cytochrome oxidoreductase complex cytochrome b subunit